MSTNRTADGHRWPVCQRPCQRLRHSAAQALPLIALPKPNTGIARPSTTGRNVATRFTASPCRGVRRTSAEACAYTLWFNDCGRNLPRNGGRRRGSGRPLRQPPSLPYGDRPPKRGQPRVDHKRASAQSRIPC
jgi:hypothetical protein